MKFNHVKTLFSTFEYLYYILERGVFFSLLKDIFELANFLLLFESLRARLCHRFLQVLKGLNPVM